MTTAESQDPTTSPTQDSSALSALASLAQSVADQTGLLVLDLQNGNTLAASGDLADDPPTAKDIFTIVRDAIALSKTGAQTAAENDEDGGSEFVRVTVGLGGQELVVTADERFVYAVKKSRG